MTAVVLQARIDSSRLPRKSLLPLGGKPLVVRVMEALRHVPCDLWVLACPEDALATFEPLAAGAGFAAIGGSHHDVLERYCLALRAFGIDRVIRATGDNPFVFADAAAAIAAEAEEVGADYAGYSGIPHGVGVEAVDSKALFRAEAEARAPHQREHVCPYLYENPDRFALHRPLAPQKWQGRGIRLTVDTEEDYENAKTLYAVLDKREASGEVSGKGRYTGEAIMRAYRETWGTEKG